MTVLERSDQAYWDHRYSEWWDRPFHGMTQNTPQEMAQEEDGIRVKLEGILQPHHRVLDAACGYGRLMPMICPRVQEYVGVDFSHGAITEAHRNAPNNAHFMVMNILDVDPITGLFDVIVLCGAESSLADRWDTVIEHLRSLLAPDGVIAVFEYGNDRILT